MNRTIHKFPLEIKDLQAVEMPIGAKILSVQFQGIVLTMWAEVDSSMPYVRRGIAIYGTGHPMPPTNCEVFVATAQQYGGGLVWHVYDLGEEGTSITAAMVSEVREATDAPMAKCWKALQDARGDVGAAVKRLMGGV